MTVLQNAWADLGGAPEALDAVHAVEVPLGGNLAAGELVHDAIAAASLARAVQVARQNATATPAVRLDPVRVWTAVTSEKHFRRGGAPESPWAELSGFWPTADGWVRTHANYPHHHDRLLHGLGMPATATADDLRAHLASRRAADIDTAVTAAGGISTVVRTPQQWHEHPQAAIVDTQPLVALNRLTDAPVSDLRRPRVLDLTRVIAGPVATRTLALWGADVLRVDPPGYPEIDWQHLDTGAGKRSTVLDARGPEFARLLASADVVVTGYRTGAVGDLGLSPHELLAAHPHLIVGRLTAWGTTGPFADRRGFDSIVQAASGIAMVESPDGVTPGALRAQALDHSAGYLLAAAITTALDRRATEGGGWLAEVSLARVAHELLRMPQRAATADPAPEPTVTTFGDLVVATPAPAFAGGPDAWPSGPVPSGSSAPEWSPE